MKAAVTSPRRSIGASSLISAWAPRKARPWPAPPSSALAKSAASECSGKASTRAASPATTSARPSGCAPAARSRREAISCAAHEAASSERGDGAEQREVAGVEQLRGVAGHHRQVQRRDHPHRARGQARAPEAGSDLGRHGGPLHAPAPAGRLRLGDRQDGDRGQEREDEGDEVAEHARRGRPLREHAGEQRPGAAAAALDDHRVERGALAIAVRLELDEPGRGRAGDHPDRQPLHRARGEQPRGVGRGGEEAEADRGGQQARGDHALSPHAVRQLAAQQQRRARGRPCRWRRRA